MDEHSLRQRLAAEAVGTAVLVFVGAGAVPAMLLMDTDAKTAFAGPSLGFVALAFGLIVAGLVYAIGKVSGCHINPAVSVALAATRRFPWREVPSYSAAQLGGAVVGGFLIWGVFGDRATKLGYGFGVVHFDQAVTSWGSAMLAEALAAGILVFVVLGAIDKGAPPAVAGVVIGLGLAAIVLVIGPVTAAATNPARAFGPLFVQTVDGSGVHNWLQFIAVYVPAEIAGAVLAALGWDALRGRERTARRAPPATADSQAPRVRARAARDGAGRSRPTRSAR